MKEPRTENGSGKFTQGLREFYFFHFTWPENSSCHKGIVPPEENDKISIKLKIKAIVWSLT